MKPRICLRYLFQTENELTIAVSGTGSAGMETCFVNLVEPGDEVVVCVNGVFGTRMCDIVGRLGANLIRVDAPWGKTIDPNAVREAVKGKSPKVLAIVHAETSTGVCQPLEEIKTIAKDAGALFLVDMVTSLGGMEVALDKWGLMPPTAAPRNASPARRGSAPSHSVLPPWTF
jgi:alanine-glyoxylate transaminase/serine-glyoxylate transaminase/serine-pyruvate transaminase